MTKVVTNPTRTAAQLIPAAVVTEFVDAFCYDMDDKQYAALLGLLLLVFSVLHNGYDVLKAKLDSSSIHEDPFE